MALELFLKIMQYSKRKGLVSSTQDEEVWVTTKTLERLLSWELDLAGYVAAPAAPAAGARVASASAPASTDAAAFAHARAQLARSRVAAALASALGGSNSAAATGSKALRDEFVGRRVAKEFGGKG